MTQKLFSLVLALGLPSVSLACSVCATGNDQARGAYYATTALLSFVPLIFIGAVVYFIAKKYRR